MFKFGFGSKSTPKAAKDNGEEGDCCCGGNHGHKEAEKTAAKEGECCGGHGHDHGNGGCCCSGH